MVKNVEKTREKNVEKKRVEKERKEKGGGSFETKARAVLVTALKYKRKQPYTACYCRKIFDKPTTHGFVFSPVRSEKKKMATKEEQSTGSEATASCEMAFSVGSLSFYSNCSCSEVPTFTEGTCSLSGYSFHPGKDGTTPFAPSFPASSPWVTSVGATQVLRRLWLVDDSWYVPGAPGGFGRFWLVDDGDVCVWLMRMIADWSVVLGMVLDGVDWLMMAYCGGARYLSIADWSTVLVWVWWVGDGMSCWDQVFIDSCFVFCGRVSLDGF